VSIGEEDFFGNHGRALFLHHRAREVIADVAGLLSHSALAERSLGIVPASGCLVQVAVASCFSFFVDIYLSHSIDRGP
jgi:hypothetical protein